MTETTLTDFFKKLEKTNQVLGEKQAEYLFHLVTKPKYQELYSADKKTRNRRVQHYLKLVYNPHFIDMKKVLKSEGIDTIEIA